jgi:hypothetical protein
MVYEVPDYKKSIDQDKFSFKLGTKTYKATRFDLLPVSFVESLGEIEEKHVVKALRLALAGSDEGLAAALAVLPVKAIKGLIEAWQENAGVTLGESKASDDS